MANKIRPLGVAVSNGSVTDRFAGRWRLWLAWAGLRESEPEERVRLP
jgi:hypothetical protein